MIVTLIPLFLAANIDVTEVDWKYGAEAIYNVQIDAHAHSEDSLLQAAATNSTLELKCRFETRLTLNCRFSEIRHVFTLLKPDGYHVMKDNDEFGQDGPGEDVFQLRFCPEGINEIVVSSSIIPSQLDMLRALVGQLNIGLELSQQNARKYAAMEKSAAGVCVTSCDLTIGKREREKFIRNNIEDYSYELVNIGETIYGDLEFLELTKIRNLNECHYRTNYFYGSRETGRESPSVIEAIRTSSKSKMTITKTDFNSYTENVVRISDKRKFGSNTIITEKMSLSLIDIVPVKEPIPTIDDASRASIFPTTWLRDDDWSEDSPENESD